MKKFLKDAKWFVFSILVVISFWYGPKISDYLEDIERERLKEERRLLAERKQKKEDEANQELFDRFIQEAANVDISGLLCQSDGLYPIRLIIPKELNYIEFVRRIDDDITDSHTYRIDRIKRKAETYLPFFSIETKKITLRNMPVFNINPQPYYDESNIYLNRETLELKIDVYQDFRYSDGPRFIGVGQCEFAKPQEIRDFVANHNKSIIGSNVL
tara:strand:+ start:1282 stop:1926 length:645 start_codon:yes stop_codon:yes gene_type:complete